MSAPADSDEIIGVGMTIGYSALPLATPAVYFDFSKLVDITAARKTRKKVTTTNHDNTDRKERQIPGFLTTGDPTFKVQYQKAWRVQLDSMVESGDSFGWKLSFPDGSYQTFTAFVSDLGDATPLEDLIEQDVTLTIVDSDAPFTSAA